MTTVDPSTRKRHWFLAAWSVPQVGHFVPSSAFVWSDKRSINIPTLNAAKQQRKLGDGAVLVSVSYVGYMTQYELTGTSADPVPSTTSAAYNLGLEQALSVADVEQLVNAFADADQFNHAEWQAGATRGFEVRKKVADATTSL